jgi:pyruvate/2-oxoglutarate dehydrogenase complex dihydrolipoamide acyltransferase (E2) component
MFCEVVVPKFAAGARWITLKQWLCRKGDKVDAGRDLAEASTDKIAIFIEAPCSGYVSELRAEEGQKVKVGQIIAVLTSESAERE